MKLLQKIHEIQKAVKGLSKDASGNGYRYVSGSKLLSYIRPAMDRLGLVLTTEIIDKQTQRLDYTTGGGKAKMEMYAEITIRFTWYDIESGENLENIFVSAGCNGIDKSIYSALSYGYRYYLLRLFNLPTDEDDVDARFIEEEREEKQLREAERAKKAATIDVTHPQFAKIEQLVMSGTKTVGDLVAAYAAKGMEFSPAAIARLNTIIQH